MSWFNTEVPTNVGALIEAQGQRKSVLSNLSNVMGELNTAIDTRVKEDYTKGALESLRSAKSLQDIQSLGLDTTKLTDAGKQQYNTGLDMLNKIALEKQREQSMNIQQGQYTMQQNQYADTVADKAKLDFTRQATADALSMPKEAWKAKYANVGGLDRLAINQAVEAQQTTNLQQSKLRAEIAKANRPTDIKYTTMYDSITGKPKIVSESEARASVNSGLYTTVKPTQSVTEAGIKREEIVGAEQNLINATGTKDLTDAITKIASGNDPKLKNKSVNWANKKMKADGLDPVKLNDSVSSGSLNQAVNKAFVLTKNGLDKGDNSNVYDTLWNTTIGQYFGNQSQEQMKEVFKDKVFQSAFNEILLLDSGKQVTGGEATRKLDELSSKYRTNQDVMMGMKTMVDRILNKYDDASKTYGSNVVTAKYGDRIEKIKTLQTKVNAEVEKITGLSAEGKENKFTSFNVGKTGKPQLMSPEEILKLKSSAKTLKDGTIIFPDGSTLPPPR